MNYAKPELAILGNAIVVVQFGSPYKNPAGGVDECLSPKGLCPPYEEDD